MQLPILERYHFCCPWCHIAVKCEARATHYAQCEARPSNRAKAED
jgi:hypothetical protein